MKFPQPKSPALFEYVPVEEEQCGGAAADFTLRPGMTIQGVGRCCKNCRLINGTTPHADGEAYTSFGGFTAEELKPLNDEGREMLALVEEQITTSDIPARPEHTPHECDYWEGYADASNSKNLVNDNLQLKRERDEARVALANVSGALVDSGVVVPEDETRYGDAVREIVRERDEALAQLAARPSNVTTVQTEVVRYEKELGDLSEYGAKKIVQYMRERDEARAMLKAVTKERLSTTGEPVPEVSDGAQTAAKCEDKRCRECWPYAPPAIASRSHAPDCAVAVSIRHDCTCGNPADGELSFTREEHDQFLAAVDKLPVDPETFAESSRFYCDNCGTNVTVDEDALCATCGGSTCTRLHVQAESVISSNRNPVTFTDEEKRLIVYALGHCGMYRKTEFPVAADKMFAAADSIAAKLDAARSCKE